MKLRQSLPVHLEQSKWISVPYCLLFARFIARGSTKRSELGGGRTDTPPVGWSVGLGLGSGGRGGPICPDHSWGLGRRDCLQSRALLWDALGNRSLLGPVVNLATAKTIRPWNSGPQIIIYIYIYIYIYILYIYIYECKDIPKVVFLNEMPLASKVKATHSWESFWLIVSDNVLSITLCLNSFYSLLWGCKTFWTFQIASWHSGHLQLGQHVKLALW